VGIFTNLGRDHYDFHGGREAYFSCKASLFSHDRCAAAVINIDDPAGRRLADIATCPVTTVSATGALPAHWRVTRTELDGGSSRFTISGPPGEISAYLPLPGAHNIDNAVSAMAAAHLRGADIGEAAAALADFSGTPGRLQMIDAGQSFVAMVDFAHNPDGLRAALGTLRRQVKRRVIVVFGAPGDRDRGKRPLMREAAAAESDVVIVTTDDPYSEDPDSIVDDIMAGADPCADEVEYIVEVDRREAIARAVRLATTGDGLLLAGRGHEIAQTVGDQVIPFDDRLELRRALTATLA
jgi:UDP-N-acetylmuramoyl-L-alanyl-D-glutamate--2,6-diaminopimelate ligase